ncbi:GNAT family N-acetyltransferase [Parapedobacter koreensis]|uniref:L-amino acid N-acyltransferase YncA n=1 Tax=Parapedobacter koreensis TaxID=332977 RepID=A0A1H7SLQ6_9SPHI|nr:GNAT family N-acetyltransferase [Parapedobacter koreensis]SEL72674.1 L-amino acid N-acyltransferase YncA [Parapedobacter koreensis]
MQNQTASYLNGQIHIRKAIKEDCRRLQRLIYELAVYSKAPEEMTVTLAEFEDAGFGAMPVWDAYVAEDSGLIIGYALYYASYSTMTGRQLYLEELYVCETHRSGGIGKLLFERIIKQSIEGGYTGISGLVLRWNESAIRFYKKYDVELDSKWLNASFSKETLSAIYEQKLLSSID